DGVSIIEGVRVHVYEHWIFSEVVACCNRHLPGGFFYFFFSSRRRHTRSVSAFLLNRSSDLIFVCLSMVQLMAVFISMRCTLCGHFLQVALTLILVVGYAIAAS